MVNASLFLLWLQMSGERVQGFGFEFLLAGLETEPFPKVRVRQPGSVLSVGSRVTAQALAVNEQVEDCFGDAPAWVLHEKRGVWG